MVALVMCVSRLVSGFNMVSSEEYIIGIFGGEIKAPNQGVGIYKITIQDDLILDMSSESNGLRFVKIEDEENLTNCDIR